jgi:large subunit ribosomal protein L29
MNAAELRKKSPEELKNLLLELSRDRFKLRMQKGTGQLSKPGDMKKVRRDIARIKTILHEMAAGKNS